MASCGLRYTERSDKAFIFDLWLMRLPHQITRRFLTASGGNLSAEAFLTAMTNHQNWLGDLAGGQPCELSGVIVEAGSEVEGMDLQQIKMTHSVLNDVTFKNCLLRGALLTGSSFHGAHFVDCDLTDAELQNSDLEQATFDRCKMMQTDISESGVEETHFDHCQMAGIIANGVQWSNTEVSGESIEVEEWNEEKFENVKRTLTDVLQASELESSGDYSGNIVVGKANDMLFHDTMDLSGTELRAHFMDCTFDGVDMSKADLRRSAFDHCDFIGVNFDKALLGRFERGVIEDTQFHQDGIDADIFGRGLTFKDVVFSGNNLRLFMIAAQGNILLQGCKGTELHLSRGLEALIENSSLDVLRVRENASFHMQGTSVKNAYWEDGFPMTARNCQFSESTLRDATWIRASVNHCGFGKMTGKMTMVGGDWTDCAFSDSKLDLWSITSTKLTVASLKDVVVEAARWVYADFSGADIARCKVHFHKGDHISFANASLRSVRLSGEVHGLDFSGATVNNLKVDKGAYIDGIKAQGAKFDRASIEQLKAAGGVVPFELLDQLDVFTKRKEQLLEKAQEKALVKAPKSVRNRPEKGSPNLSSASLRGVFVEIAGRRYYLWSADDEQVAPDRIVGFEVLDGWLVFEGKNFDGILYGPQRKLDAWATEVQNRLKQLESLRDVPFGRVH